ncbi:hypothetical protein [Streptomyces sp. SudanB182_2057]
MGNSVEAGSPHCAVTVCRIREVLPVHGIVHLPAHHDRVSA